MTNVFALKLEDPCHHLVAPVLMSRQGRVALRDQSGVHRLDRGRLDHLEQPSHLHHLDLGQLNRLQHLDIGQLSRLRRLGVGH